jgi:hypothetical protein
VADPGYGAGTAEGRQWRLALSAPARKLVIFFIVFGAVVAMGVSVVNAIQAANSVSTLTTTLEVTAATFAELGAATSAGQYDSTLRSSGVVQEMAQFGTAYDNLISALAS